MYKITKYSKDRAKELGVKIKPSHNPKKKLDVFDWNGQYICSVRAIGYSDYPTYMKTEGKEYADERRRLYHIRHRKEKELGSPGYYAKELLW
jgi:hypothetical protein